MTGQAPAPGKHPCPGPGCPLRVDNDLLACRAHWYQVPARVRGAVYAAWDRGRGAGTPAHTAACAAAVRYMRPTGALR